MMLWVKDAPNLDTEEGRVAALAFIDMYINTQFPERFGSAEDERLYELVLRVQNHDHTFICNKETRAGASGRCRFNYSKPVSDRTRLKINPDRGLRSTDLYVIKRGPTETMIIPYNQKILLRQNANMDIQMIGELSKFCYLSDNVELQAEISWTRFAYLKLPSALSINAHSMLPLVSFLFDSLRNIICEPGCLLQIGCLSLNAFQQCHSMVISL
jgi:hypothetical protein